MSTITDLLDGGIRQLAFVVPDAAEAARRHSELTGSGPFYVMPHYKMAIHEYRGAPSDLDVTSAYGQWGEVQVEFVQVHNEEPSAYRDTYPDGGPGMHHVAVFCDNLDETIKAFEAEGFPIVMYAAREKGKEYAMFDTREKVGFMVEVYEEAVVGPFYKMIRDAAADFDGTDPVRIREFTEFVVTGK